MSPEKTKYLYEKYPEIFCQKDLSIQQSAMPWGFDCSDGWFAIIDELCSSIQNHIENENRNIEYKIKRGELPPDAPNFTQVEAVQVKEKFGGLRFYINYYDDFIRGLIDMAEGMSLRTCEICGNPGKPNNDGWISTQCEPCRAGEEERRRKMHEEAMQRLTVKMNDVTVAP